MVAPQGAEEGRGLVWLPQAPGCFPPGCGLVLMEPTPLRSRSMGSSGDSSGDSSSPGWEPGGPGLGPAGLLWQSQGQEAEFVLAETVLGSRGHWPVSSPPRAG